MFLSDNGIVWGEGGSGQLWATVIGHSKHAPSQGEGSRRPLPVGMVKGRHIHKCIKG